MQTQRDPRATAGPASPAWAVSSRHSAGGLERSWIAWVAVSVVAVAAYYFLPEAVQSHLYDGIGVCAAAVMLAGAILNRAEPRPAWVLFAFGVLALSVGDIVFGTYQPVPSNADMFYLTGHVVLVASAIGLVRRHGPDLGRSALVDAGGIATAVVLATLLFMGTIRHPAELATSAVSIAYPLLDVVLLGLIVRVASTTRGSRAFLWLLAVATLLELVGDGGYTFQGYGSQYALGSWLDATWLLAYASYGAALLHPSVGATPVLAPVPAQPHPAQTRAAPVAARPKASRRDPYLQRYGSTTAFQALRLRKVLSWSGLMALAIGGVTFLAGVGLKATDVVFLAGVYGMSGMLMVISGAVHPRGVRG